MIGAAELVDALGRQNEMVTVFQGSDGFGDQEIQAAMRYLGVDPNAWGQMVVGFFNSLLAEGEEFDPESPDHVRLFQALQAGFQTGVLAARAEAAAAQTGGGP